MTLLRCFSGQENWKGHSAKFHGFVSPTTGATEAHLLAAARDPSLGVLTARSGERHVAKHGYPMDVVGYWTDNAHEIQNGTVCKIYGTRNVGGFGLGVGGATAAVYLLVREEAAFRRIKMPLSGDPNARYSAAFAQGRFDLLTPEEAAEYGVRILPMFKAQASAAAQARVFLHETVEPEISPRVSIQRRVVQVAGEAPVTIPVRRRVRPVHF